MDIPDKYEFILIHNKRPVKFTGQTVDQITDRVHAYLGDHGDKASRNSVHDRVVNQLKTRAVQTGKKKAPTLEEAFHASLALFRYASGKHVDQAELDRRAEICLTCPKRSKTSFCSGCGGLGRATRLLNEARRLTKNSLTLPYNLRTEFCGVCGCSLPLLLVTEKTHLPQDDPIQSKERPDHCWIK